MTEPLRVLLADDQTLVRTGFRLILGADGIDVVAEATDGTEAVEAVRRTRPDVVLMDVRMPRMDGLEATRRILTGAPDEPRVIILTTFDLDRYVYAALTAGASGFLLKDVTPEQLTAAVRTVRTGDALLAPAITRRLVQRFAGGEHRYGAGGEHRYGAGGEHRYGAGGEHRHGAGGEHRHGAGGEHRHGATDEGRYGARSGGDTAALHRDLAPLTPRELEVLGLLARGLSNAELAGRLHLAEATVKTHVARVLAKLGLRDRVQAVIVAYETGLVSAGAHEAAPSAPEPVRGRPAP
ncbi:response regulator transcription factor [Streptomyces sp. XY152]|uniref:response regulator transcription factor n=1 Tax=Streptomyces sp. XY152 TaxID=1415560 RepID=UPI0006AD8DF4|nr:response regulator transcription factor [Streptomyces sp. XY152]